jgi:hypothetical protein
MYHNDDKSKLTKFAGYNYDIPTKISAKKIYAPYYILYADSLAEVCC